MTPEGIPTEELQNLITFSRDELTKNLQDIIKHAIPVWRKNIDGIIVTIPVNKLGQYMGEHAEEFTFYINKDWKSKIKNEQPFGPQNRLNVSSFIKQLEQYGNVTDQTERFKKMSIVDREEILDQGLEQLNNMKETKDKLDLSVIVSMVDVVAYTFYSNHANLLDITESPNLRNNIMGIMVKTRWILSNLIELLKLGLYSYKDFNFIEEIATRSTTFDHITRVLLKFIAFCIFFNHYIDKGFIAKNIRAVFRDKYVRYYKKRLDVKSISIETVFKDGIRRIDETTELVEYSLGALLFDMGKLPDLKYHDSIEHYDEKIVKKHVLNSYNMIMNANIYSFTVSSMAAFHHELYGSNAGYHFTNAIISKLSKIKRDNLNINYFITYDEKEFINGLALAYFPIKILEIVDIFDALKNKKKKSAFDTLMMMKKEFITKSLKIDPILYTIFLDFNLNCGLISPKEYEDIDEIIF
jgi:hypothetical protein